MALNYNRLSIAQSKLKVTTFQIISIDNLTLTDDCVSCLQSTCSENWIQSSKVVNEKAYSDQWVCDLNVKMSKIITTAEVKKHNTKDSVWMIIHNDVYDVTNYLDEVSK